jgi:hypothetical protein
LRGADIAELFMYLFISAMLGYGRFLKFIFGGIGV